MSLSASVAVRVIALLLESSNTTTDWLSDIGGSLTKETVIVMVAVLLSLMPSLALKVKASDPLALVWGKLGLGEISW